MTLIKIQAHTQATIFITLLYMHIHQLEITSTITNYKARLTRSSEAGPVCGNIDSIPDMLHCCRNSSIRNPHARATNEVTQWTNSSPQRHTELLQFCKATFKQAAFHDYFTAFSGFLGVVVNSLFQGGHACMICYHVRAWLINVINSWIIAKIYLHV